MTIKWVKVDPLVMNGEPFCYGSRLTVRQVLELRTGSVVELDRMAGDSVDVLVNNRLMARGEVVVVDDKFGIRITELVQQTQRAEESE